MTYQKNKPASSDNPSDSQADIAANFTAIEEGADSLQYDKLNIQQQGSDPGALASNVRLYSKAGTTYPSLFAQNSNGEVYQLSDDDSLGSTSTKLKLDSMTFDGTNLFSENSIPNAAIVMAGTGAITYSFGIDENTANTLRTDTGVYKITFSTPRTTANYYVALTQESAAGTRGCRVATKATTHFTVNTYNGTTATNTDFNAIVIGGW